MIRCDLLDSFAGALGDLPYFVRLERGVLTHRVKISRGLLGSARVGGMCVIEVGPWRLLPSTMALSFLSVLGVLSRYLPTRRAVETWIGGSVGVASVPSNRRPSKVPADSGSMNSLRRTPPM